MPWRHPVSEQDFPTLGWLVLAWSHAYLPSPADETQPLVYTDEQARRILRWFEIDPTTGEFVYETLVLEEAKGFGKSPFAASLAIAGLVGPVCFDGWDARGEPVGVPWGTGERPPPWNQIAAVSEDQTDNTYGAAYSMLVANDGRAADALGIDAGRTRLYLRDRPGRLEPVTASAGSREGQRLTDPAILDETHLWNPRNGGVKLARTLRRNLAKMGGRSIETTNAPILGERSVAEQRDPDAPEAGVLHYCRRPSLEPEPDWEDDKMREVLADVYGDAVWVDRERILREIRNPVNPWADARQFWFNTRGAAQGRAVDPRLWELRRSDVEVPTGTLIGLGFDGSISHDATVLRGCTHEGHSFILGAWFPRPGDPPEWTVPRLEVHQAVAEAFARYRVGLMLADPPRWYSEIEEWARLYGEDTVLAFDTSQTRRFAPAVDRWLSGLREGTHTHDGDPLTAEHVKAAHLRKVRISDPDDDGRTMYVLVKGDDRRRIDAAVADVLALEAAATMPELRPSEPLVSWA